MAKYRGKHNGKTRGKYIEALLSYEPKPHEDVYDLDTKVHIYLCDLGYNTLQSIEIKNSSHELRAYHVAGATISMITAKKPWFDTPEHREDFKQYIQLHLTSNDSLEDVISKITQKFPFFKNIDPKYARDY